MKMKKFLLVALIGFLGFANLSFGQVGCRIEIGIIPPLICVGNTLCVPYDIVPNGCIDPASIRIDISQPLANPGAPCDFSPLALTGPGNCITIPLTFQKGRYCVRLRSGNIVSDVKSLEIDTIDFSPAPTLKIVQLPPIRPSYCPDDTIKFRIINLANAGVGYTVQWSKNDTATIGATDTVYSITGLFDNDFVFASVTKQSKCARFATGRSDSIRIKVNKKPKVRIVLAPGSTGCELTLNSFIAKPDSAGPNPTYIWTRVSGTRIDTLSQGINDTLFTLSPADSAKFGDQICVEIVDGRCKLKAKDCYNIRACGQVFIDPPLVSSICAGTILNVPYTVKGSFDPANLFAVQLSDSLGSFANPIIIGTLVSRRADTIRALIPGITPAGNCYKVRIISTLPRDTSDTSACIRVFPKPPVPTAVNDSVCKAGTVTLNASPTLLGATINWYTRPTGGSPVFVGNSRTLFIARDTTFFISQTSTSGCESDRVPIQGIVKPAPVVDAGPDRRVCVGDGPVVLNPFPAAGNWTGSLLVTNNTIDLTGIPSGIYKFAYRVTGANGCTTIDSLVLTVAPKPVVNAGPDRQFCSNNQPALFTGSPQGGAWTGIGIQSDGTFVPSAAGAGTFSLIYTFTQDGCTARDTASVVVNEAPPIFTVTTTNPSACNVEDGTATLAGISTGPGFKVKWSVNRADSLSDPSISNLKAGAYTVVVTNLSTGCRRTAAFGLSDPTAPEPVISGLSANYCSADPCVTMQVSPISPSGTFSGPGVTGNQFCPADANLGANIVVYSYDTTGGCTGTTTVLVRVNESPVVNAGGPVDTVCRSVGTFTLSGFSPGAPPASWGPQPLVSTLGVVNLGIAASGVNTLTLSRTLGTCQASDTRTLFVYDAPSPVIVRSPLQSVCQGQSVLLTATIQNNIPVNRYEWFLNGELIPGQNGNTLTALAAGSYTVKTKGAGACEETSAPIILNFNPLPTNGINPNGILTPCSNALTVLTADSSAGYTFQWFGLDSIPGATLRTFTPSVSGQYRVKIRNGFDCHVFSSIVDVNILQAPEAPIVSPPFQDTCLQAGQPVTITVGSSGSGLSFSWFRVGPPDVQLSGNGPSRSFTTAGSYYAVVTAANGCSTRSQNINLLPTIGITAVDSVFEKCQGSSPFQITGLAPTTNCRLLFNGVPLTNNIFNPANAGTFILTYECTNANGCISRKNIQVVVSIAPPANLLVQGPTNVCEGDSVRLVINEGLENGSAYQLLRNGTPVGQPFTSPFVFVKTNGTYSIQVTRLGCSRNTNAISVNFRKKPRADAGLDINQCSPVVRNLNEGIPTPGNWSGSVRVVTNGEYNSANFVGCDTLTLTVDSANGCSNTDTKVICVRPVPNFETATINATACLTNNGKAWVENAFGQNLSFVWRKVGDPLILSETDSLLNALPGAYSVEITSNATGCSITRPALINSPNNLTVSVAGAPDSVCANAVPIQLTGLPDGNGVFTSFNNRIVDGSRFDPSLPGSPVDTIYYTATVNGCTGTGKKVIKINPIPVVDAGPNSSVCFGDTLILRAVQPANENLIWVGPQIVNDSLYIANDPGITSSIVTVGYTRNGCSNTDSRTITVTPLPVFTLNVTDVTACGLSNGSATRNILNPNQFQTTWRNVQNGQIIGTGGTVSNLAVGIYSITIRNNTSGCRAFETFGITGPTNINPFVCLQNVPTAICQNLPPVTIGKCSPTASVFINGVNTQILNPAIQIPGNIGVLLTDTDANGCIGVEQKIVQINPAPVVNVSGVGPTFACTNQNNVQLSGFFPQYDASIPENGWTAAGAPAGFITRDGRINATLINQDQTITLTYTAKTADPNGCSDSKTIQFQVYKTPEAAIIPNTNPVTVCEGQSVLLSSATIEAGYQYTWFLGNQSNPPSVGFGPTLNASLPGVYRLQVNNNGCRSEFSGVVTVVTNPSPIIANIGPDTTICQGSGIFQIPAPSVVGSFTSAIWSAVAPTPTTLISSGGVVTPSNGGLGQNVVRFIVTNGSCSDTAFRTFTINPNIDSPLQLIGSSEICEGDNVVIKALASAPEYSYRWTRNGITIPGASADSIVVNQAGIYRVLILVNGNGECALPSTQSIEIVVKPSPSVSITGEKILPVCYPSQAIDLNAVRPYSPIDAIWSGPAGIVSANGVLTPANIQADGDIRLILSKTIGTCSDSDTLIVRARAIPSAVFTSSSEAICDGDAVQFVYNNPRGYNNTWLRDNSVIATNRDTLTIDQPGVYTLEVNNGGCSANFSRTIEIRSKPTFDLPASLSVCKNGEAQQFFPINPSPGLGSWSGPGINATGGWNPADDAVPSSGLITINYTRTSEFGCTLTKSFTITIDPVPLVSITTDKPVIEIFGPAQLSAQVQNATPGTYAWSPAASLSATNTPTVAARPDVNTRYSLTVTSDKGCVGSASIDIEVDQEFKIYDGFSPNNDQKNDVWIIKNIQRYPEAIVRIYNRWGNLIYESEKGYPKPWDGKYEGKEVPPGAYYYIIELGQGLTSKSGSVTLVR